MKKEKIVRAWKDPKYRASLTNEERAALPESPSGELQTRPDEAELGKVMGGLRPRTLPLYSCMYRCWSVDICNA